MFHDLVQNMEANNYLSTIVSELFVRGRKLNISPLFFFISQPYFKVFKTTTLNATYHFIIKISNESELQQIASNHSSDTEFKDFVKFYIDHTKKPY